MSCACEASTGAKIKNDAHAATLIHVDCISPRYLLRIPVILGSASQARHDSRPQSSMIRGVLSPGLVGG
jgi:hypothetical protein